MLTLGTLIVVMAATGPARGGGAATPSPRTVLAPPATGMYHAAYPDFVGTEDRVTTARIQDFERLARRRIVWAYFSDNWISGIAFPSEDVAAIVAAGRVPFIRLMPRSTWRSGGPDPIYTMQRIVDGEFDPQLHAWFAAAAATGIPLMVEFGTEVDGDWFAWNGRWNGGGTLNGYGDPTVPDGPERFRDAYRHIVDISRAEGATDLTWTFHVNSEPWPHKPWNTPAAYYPGDDYVDWIGVSIYGSGAPGEWYGTFKGQLDTVYPTLCALSPDKPLAVLEWGIAQRPARGTKAGWIKDALYWLRAGRWPRIKAVSYWHEDWRNADGTRSNLRIDSSAGALWAYRLGIRGPAFVTEPAFTTTP